MSLNIQEQGQLKNIGTNIPPDKELSLESTNSVENAAIAKALQVIDHDIAQLLQLRGDLAKAGLVQLSNRSDVTESAGLAVPASELNPTIEGSIANQIAKIFEKAASSTYTEMLYYEDASPEDALKRYIEENSGKRNTSGFAWIQADTCRIAVLAIRDDAVGNNTCGLMLWFGMDKVQIKFYLKNVSGLSIFNIPFDQGGNLRAGQVSSIQDILFLADYNGKCIVNRRSSFMPEQMQNMRSVCSVSTSGTDSIICAYGLDDSTEALKVAMGNYSNGNWYGWHMVRE